MHAGKVVYLVDYMLSVPGLYICFCLVNYYHMKLNNDNNYSYAYV